MRVLVREPIADAGVELLRSRFDVDVDLESPLEEIIDRYDGIVIRSATHLGRDEIERAANLKVIGRAGVGVDNVDVDAATRRGIVVANAPESTIVSAAEQTIGLLVALARNIPQAHAALKQGRWERSRWSGIATGDQGVFVRAQCFHRLGGFADLLLMEDIEFSRRARTLGRPACPGGRLVTSGRRWDHHGAWRTIALMSWLRLRFWLGADARALHALYYPTRGKPR